MFLFLISIVTTPCAFGQTMVGVQKERVVSKAMRTPGNSLRSEKTTAWPDSTLTYDADGKKIGKDLYFYDSENNLTRRETWFLWSSGNWTEFYRYEYTYDGDITTEYWYNSYSGELSESPDYVGRTHKKKKVYPYYDANEKRTYIYSPSPLTRYVVGDGFEETYDDRGNLVSIITLYEGNKQLYKIDISYDENNNPILIEWKDADKNDNVGAQPFKYVYKWDSKGHVIYAEEWEWAPNGTEEGELKLMRTASSGYTYDSYGNETMAGSENNVPTFKTVELLYTPGITPQVQNYSWQNNDWALDSYDVYYPSSSTSVESDNSEPVGDENKGGFDIIIHIPADSVAGGSFVIDMPEGFMLDTDNTKLTVNFNQFELLITKQEGNTWMLEIKAKTKAFKAASVQSDVPTALAHIAYSVDKATEKGNYDIILNSICFTTPDGNAILEPEMTVPVLLNRWATSSEKIQVPEVAIFSDGKTLIIDSPVAETIDIYSITGAQIYHGLKPAGKITVRTVALPDGMIIIKGSSNCVKKMLTK